MSSVIIGPTKKSQKENISKLVNIIDRDDRDRELYNYMLNNMPESINDIKHHKALLRYILY